MESSIDIGMLSIDRVIELIRITRNELITEFLHDDRLAIRFKGKYGKTLSNVKREFVKRELKELLNSPVDLVHYAGLINHAKTTGSFSLVEHNAEFFHSEIDRILVKYLV